MSTAVARIADLPTEGRCNICGATKPRGEMCVVRRRDLGGFYMRPKCKACNNERERGHRREYKRLYLQRWRRENAALDKSYWSNDHAREKQKLRARTFSQRHKDAIAIQRRMAAHDYNVTLAEARDLLEKYGRCYPTRYGLTKAGLLECERIRNRLRNRNVDRRRRQTAFEIRLMVYEENDGNFSTSGWVIHPDRQPVPYPTRAEGLRKYWQERKAAEVSA